MILFDLETTGLPKAEGSDLDMQPSIIEFGAIKLDDDLEETARMEFLCNPGHPLPPMRCASSSLVRKLWLHTTSHLTGRF